MITKLQAQTLIRQFIDDPNDVLWSDTNLDLVTGSVYDSLWTRFLGFNNKLLSQLDTIAAADINSPGFVDLRLTATGDLSQRFFRLQDVVRSGQSFRPVDPRFVTIEGNEVKDGPTLRYYIRDNELWLFPLKTDTDVEVTYAFLPPVYTGLADAAVLVWPEGHESALYLTAASLAIAKGDREDPSTLRTLANDAVQATFEAIERHDIHVTVFLSSSDAVHFGAVN